MWNPFLDAKLAGRLSRFLQDLITVAAGLRERVYRLEIVAVVPSTF